MSKKKVIVIGGGIAGMQTAMTLRELGLEPLVIEKSEQCGGKLNRWDRLFPTMTPAHEVLDEMKADYKAHSIETRLNSEVMTIDADNRCVVLASGEKIAGDALVITSGFELFDAHLKEEYGYGIYDNVFTSADLEQMFREDRVLTADGRVPERVAILHCVGSRDEKVRQNHCSRVCCVTGVKQAIEIKQKYSDTEVYNFYMDMRMFGPGYEELYRTSQQEYGVNHLRGRISEASQMIDGRIQIKAEDTLVGRPLRMTVDMLILLVGMCAGASNEKFSSDCSLELRPSNFMKPLNAFNKSNLTAVPGIYLAGTVKAPKNISETLHDAVSAAHNVHRYLTKQ